MATAFATSALVQQPRATCPYAVVVASTSFASASARAFQRHPARPYSLRNTGCERGYERRSEFGSRGASSSSSSSVTCCPRAGLDALVFDCDGVILESEDLHRRAYNAAFQEFQVRSPPSADAASLEWTPEFYDELQNQIGGGKPKMRWYFGKHGWPTSTILPNAPSTDEEQATLIDTIQDWKTEKYKSFIGSGDVEPRPGVLELMDATRKKGVKLAVCSAATRSSVVLTLSNLLGKERFEGLDCFLAAIFIPRLRLSEGDDVDKKKPDPTIYIKAAQALGVAPENCLVVEDSLMGLKAASGAGMSCIISYTSSTSTQDFSGAKAVYPNLGSVRLEDLIELLEGSTVSL